MGAIARTSQHGFVTCHLRFGTCATLLLPAETTDASHGQYLALTKA